MYTTRRTLLQKVNDGSQVAWEDFQNTYSSLIRLRGKDRGLANHELDDLIQDVLLSLFKQNSIFKYDNSKGRFRDYLKTIIDRRSFDLIRKRKNASESLNDPNSSIVLSSDDHERAEKHWQEEWQNHILNQALLLIEQEVNANTIEAFRLLSHMKAEQVAKKLGMTTDGVYVAKHRVLKRIKPILKKLDDGTNC